MSHVNAMSDMEGREKNSKPRSWWLIKLIWSRWYFLQWLYQLLFSLKDCSIHYWVSYWVDPSNEVPSTLGHKTTFSLHVHRMWYMVNMETCELKFSRENLIYVKDPARFIWLKLVIVELECYRFRVKLPFCAHFSH